MFSLPRIRRNTWFHRVTILAGAALVWLSLLPAARADDRIQVVASFSILGDLVQQVGQEHVAVSTLVGPDGDAHTYEPTPQDIAKLSKSNLFVMNGLGLEGWIDRLINASHYKGKVVIASQGLTPLPFKEMGEEEHEAGHDAAHEHHHQWDPHAWHSIPNAIQYVNTIAAALSAQDPAHQQDYQHNASQYIATLQALDKDLLARFAAIPAAQRKMITSHDAFGYLAHRYQITTIAPQGMSTEAEASAKEIASIIKQIRSEKITALFVENITDPRLIQQISRETKVEPGKELYSDALSPAGGPATTYLDMMRYNTTQILQALQAK